MSRIGFLLNKLGVLTFSVCLMTGPAIAQASFTQLFAFGGGLTDTGNTQNFFGLPLPPYATGRLSNGPVWIDGLAASLGLPVVDSSSGGSNYAWGGARTGPPGSVLPPLPLLDQAATFLSDVGGVASPTALYVIWGGRNDVRENDSATAASDIAAIITDLATAGATHFLVPNLPDMGMTPESLDGTAPGGAAAVITAATLAYNAALAAELSNLSATLGTVTIFELDVYTLFNQFLSNPAGFGFTNVSDPCWDGDFFGIGTQCGDPDQYLFWDGINPSAAAHAFLGDSASNLVVADVDTDLDGVFDSLDNCTDVANPDQRDTDGDGHGNACDADLNNDCIVNFTDLGLLGSVFFTTPSDAGFNSDADFSGDDIVNVIDLGILKMLFFGPPGPSAPALCNM